MQGHTAHYGKRGLQTQVCQFWELHLQSLYYSGDRRQCLGARLARTGSGSGTFTHPRGARAGDSSSGSWRPAQPHLPGPGGWSRSESRGRVGPRRGPCDIGSVGGSRVRSEVKLAPSEVSSHAGWAGRPGVSATRGREAGGPRARVGGASLEQGKGSSKRQRRCLRAARPAAGAGDRDSWDPGVGDTLPWGVCSPTPSNRRQLRAGGRGAAVSGAGGVLTCWAPKHTSGGGGDSPDPCPEPWPSSSLTAPWPALGTPAPPSQEGPHRAATHAGNPLLPTQDPGHSWGRGCRGSRKAGEEPPTPALVWAEGDPEVSKGRDFSPKPPPDTCSGHFPLVLQGWTPHCPQN